MSYRTSPLGIEIMLHYYYSPQDYRDGDFESSAVIELIIAFSTEGMLSWNDPSEGGAKLGITPRGHAYVESLLRVPPPTQTTIWHTEWPKEEIIDAD